MINIVRTKSVSISVSSLFGIILILGLLSVFGSGCNSSNGQPSPQESFPCTAENPFSNPNVAGGNMCSQFYSLCIAAPCESVGAITPTGFEDDTFVIGSGLADSGDILEHAECKCPVINGNSIGKATCENRAQDGPLNTSTYSFQFNNDANRLLLCEQQNFEEDLIFADCYNQPCILDPEDPTMAICTCPVFPVTVSPDQSYITRGGECDQNSCTELWSAATTGAFPLVNQAMACGIGNPQPAAQFNCQ